MLRRRRFEVRAAMLCWAALATTIPAVPTRADSIFEAPTDVGTRSMSGTNPPTLSNGTLSLLDISVANSAQTSVDSIVEFDTRAIATIPPGAVINSAILTLNIAGAQTISSPAGVSVNGYPDGDGIVGLGDFVKTTTLLGNTGDLPNGSPGSLNIPFQFDVTNFIQSIADGKSPFVGFHLEGPAGDSSESIWGNGAPNPAEVPHLAISFTAVPEPSGALLMGLGLVGLLALAWRRVGRAAGG